MLGSICGDVLGSIYECECKKYDDIFKIKLMTGSESFTDDTVLTAAIADWLLHDVGKDKGNWITQKEALIKKIATYAGELYRGRGYGGQFVTWVAKYQLLRESAPYNSFGNGSAMRVGPVGWWFDTLEETRRYAILTAEITHNHMEGIRGAEAVASAIYLARTGNSKKEIQSFIKKNFKYHLSDSMEKARKKHEWSVTCQECVPAAIIAFLESTDYESAVRNAISLGGDSDTIAAITGSIAEAYYKEIPHEIKEFCIEKLDPHMKGIVKEFYSKISTAST